MGIHHIENYQFGEVTIDGKRYHKDVIILPEQIIDNWRRGRGHYLQIKDLDAVLQERPQVLVIGQGAYSRMIVPNELLNELRGLGIELFKLPTREACEKFNQINPDKTTAAALHLTC